ncbi:class I SAM-dependent methyltransferase [Streptomyces sp. NPDC046853]|uniref:class I SAM-dependent methyltransferase n=1 Tax=Streptomyces sp. NPDC046853 TaxID=3154920 RepID=UPI0033D1DE4A
MPVTPTHTARAAAARAEKVFAVPYAVRRHRARARAMAPFGEPESWLDIDTGHGHFPAVAREVHPYTAFDGLDPTGRVEEGRRAGRVEEAHVGLLADLATGLAGRYDVLSMFHYLERSEDPRIELIAARTVLRPGGHLMIEVPVPQSRYARLLGKGWLRPGPHHPRPGPHQPLPGPHHDIPLSALRRDLESLGYTVVATERREPHIPFDLAAGLALTLGRMRATARVAAPLLAAAALADRLLAPLVSRTRFSNAYRVIARRGPKK